MPHTVVVLSGGLDSTVALWSELSTATLADQVIAVTVDYGQRHLREIAASQAIVEHWQQDATNRRREGHPAATLTHVIINAASLGRALPGSALTDQTIAVPHGHYAAPNMDSTIVPNRNMIIASMAAGIAISHGADRVFLGIHAGDHPIYPDCRLEFVEAFETCVRIATKTNLVVSAPFLTKTKDMIVTTGKHLGAPMHLTWSCYQGGDRHCGKCGTCVERREAFDLAGVNDPTKYEE